MAFKFTEEQLNTLDKSFIVNLFLQLQDQNDKLSGGKRSIASTLKIKNRRNWRFLVTVVFEFLPEVF